MNNRKTAIILGAGSIGKRHASNLKSFDIEVIFIRRKIEPSLDLELGVKSITWTDFNSSKTKYDYGFICTPTNQHIDDLFKIDKRVDRIFLEKPLCSSVTEINSNLNSINPSKVFIGFMLREHPAIVKLHNLVFENKNSVVGGTFHFGSFMPSWHPYEDYKQSYAARKEMGGGVVRTISHEIDLAYWFFGKPKSVFASYNKESILKIGAEERASILLIYSSFSININLNYLERYYNRFINIYLEHSRFFWDWNKNKVIEDSNTGKVQHAHVENFETNQLYIDELDFFLSNSTFPNECNLNHAIAIQKLIDKIEESNKTGKIINT